MGGNRLSITHSGLQFNVDRILASKSIPGLLLHILRNDRLKGVAMSFQLSLVGRLLFGILQDVPGVCHCLFELLLAELLSLGRLLSAAGLEIGEDELLAVQFHQDPLGKQRTDRVGQSVLSSWHRLRFSWLPWTFYVTSA